MLLRLTLALELTNTCFYILRHPDQKDPPYEPSQMFMVTRVKGLRGKPYWEKYIMERHLRIVKVSRQTKSQNGRKTWWALRRTKK